MGKVFAVATWLIDRIICTMLVAISLCVALSISALAHAGRTDSNGGHRDNNNVSGLGSYHYHHGYSAHLHPGGVCPYDNPVSSSSNDEPSGKVTLPKWNFYSGSSVESIKDKEYDKGYAKGYEKGKTETTNKFSTRIEGQERQIQNQKETIAAVNAIVDDKDEQLKNCYIVIGIESLILIILFFRSRASHN